MQDSGPRRPRLCKTCTWPTSPETWCWHCCHPCNKVPIPMPVNYCENSDTFTVRGAFCSWPCMRAYLRDSVAPHRSSIQAMNMAVFRKRCEPGRKMERSFPAPPRQLLNVFGGTMTLEEFRGAAEKGTTYSFLPPKMLPHMEILEEQRASSRLRAPVDQDLNTSVDFQNVSSKNETLRLRRSKPQKAETTTLERAMGISQFLLQS